MESFENTKAISYGKNPTKAIEKARAKGIDSPVVICVPEHNQIY